MNRHGQFQSSSNGSPNCSPHIARFGGSIGKTWVVLPSQHSEVGDQIWIIGLPIGYALLRSKTIQISTTLSEAKHSLHPLSASRAQTWSRSRMSHAHRTPTTWVRSKAETKRVPPHSDSVLRFHTDNTREPGDRPLYHHHPLRPASTTTGHRSTHHHTGTWFRTQKCICIRTTLDLSTIQTTCRRHPLTARQPPSTFSRSSSPTSVRFWRWSGTWWWVAIFSIIWKRRMRFSLARILKASLTRSWTKAWREHSLLLSPGWIQPKLGRNWNRHCELSPRTCLCSDLTPTRIVLWSAPQDTCRTGMFQMRFSFRLQLWPPSVSYPFGLDGGVEMWFGILDEI